MMSWHVYRYLGQFAHGLASRISTVKTLMSLTHAQKVTQKLAQVEVHKELKRLACFLISSLFSCASF